MLRILGRNPVYLNLVYGYIVFTDITEEYAVEYAPLPAFAQVGDTRAGAITPGAPDAGTVGVYQQVIGLRMPGAA